MSAAGPNEIRVSLCEDGCDEHDQLATVRLPVPLLQKQPDVRRLMAKDGRLEEKESRRAVFLHAGG
jgi:hypothetical protein